MALTLGILLKANSKQAREELRSTAGAMDQLTASTKELARVTQVAGGRFAKAAEKLRAEGLSAAEVTGALRSMGATQAEIAQAVGGAVQGVARASANAARKVDYMTGAMAYGTARAAAFGANLGPVGYVIGSIARASERLAPILSSLFGVALGFMAVEMVGRFVSSLEQAHIKLEQTQGQLIAWGAAQDKAAAQARLLTLQLGQQIAKLEGIPVPDALQIALTKDRIAADALAQSLGQAAQKTIGMMSKAAPAWYQELGSYAQAAGAAMAYAAGSLGLFARGAIAAAPRLASLSIAEDDILSSTLALEKITAAQAEGTLSQTAAYDRERPVLGGLISKLQGLSSQQGLTKAQQLALTEAARGYEDELVRLNEAQKQIALNQQLQTLQAAGPYSAAQGKLREVMAQVAAALAGNATRTRSLSTAYTDLDAATKTLELDQSSLEYSQKHGKLTTKQLGEVTKQLSADLKSYNEAQARAERLSDMLTKATTKLYATLSPAQKAMAAASHGMNVHTMTMGEWGRVSKAANEAAMQHAATMAASAPGIHGGNVALEQLGAHADRLRLTKNEIAQLNVLLPQFGKNFQLNMGLATQAIRSFQAVAPRTMEEFSQALGKNIAMAILYGASVTKAMERALKGILASITAQAAIKAILETAKGFEYLADRMYPQAALAFKSAALYGSIGAAAGAIASAIPGGGGGGRGAGRGAAGYGAQRGGGPPGTVGGYRGAGGGSGQYHQTIVNVYGTGLVNTTDLQNLVAILNQGGQGGTVRLNIAGSSNTIPTPSY